MTIVDALIIYLTFGSPMMVYRYLLSSRLGQLQRVYVSIFTLAFWVPLAAQMVYRRLTNAYSRLGFVSVEILDAVDRSMADIRKALKTEPSHFGGGALVRDLLQSIERYAALSIAAREVKSYRADRSDLFAITGTNAALGNACVQRRNAIRLEDHYTRSRADLLLGFQTFAEFRGSSVGVGKLLIDIAHLLDDPELARKLTGIDDDIDRTSSYEQQPLAAKLPTSFAPAIAMTVAPPNSD